MNWFSQNWDKVIAVVLSSAVAGIIGFFSAIFSVQQEISSLSERIIETENSIEILLKSRIEPIEAEFVDTDYGQRLRDNASEIDLLEQHVKQSLERRLKEIEAFLSKITLFELRLTEVEAQSAVLISHTEIMLDRTLQLNFVDRDPDRFTKSR